MAAHRERVSAYRDRPPQHRQHEAQPAREPVQGSDFRDAECGLWEPRKRDHAWVPEYPGGRIRDAVQRSYYGPFRVLTLFHLSGEGSKLPSPAFLSTKC